MKQSLFAVATLLPSLVSLAACSASPSPTSDEPVGTLDAALSVVGSDGATYSVPTSNVLLFTSPSTGTTCRSIGATATQSFALPVGAYSVWLGSSCSGPTGDAGTDIPFTLARAADAGPTSVGALLVSPQQTVTVTAGGTSALTFQFIVESLGTLTTGTGTVVVSISADAGGVQSPVSGSAAGSFGPTNWVVGGAPIAGVTTLLSPSGSVTVSLGLSALSAFTPNADDTICASFVPVLTGTSSQAGLSALFQEIAAPGTTGLLCFFDQNFSSTPSGYITISRFGTPVTSAFQSALTNGATISQASFQFASDFDTPAWVYNGSTISLAPFASPVTLTPYNESAGVWGTSGVSAGYVAANMTSTLTLTLLP